MATKRASPEERAKVLAQIEEYKKTMSTEAAAKKVGIPVTRYYGWVSSAKRRATPKKVRAKAKQTTAPTLVTLPFHEEGEQPVCVIFGPADKVNAALSNLAEIYRSNR